MIALAAMGFAACASAQSSVSLFGVIDTGVTYGHGDLTNRVRLTNSNWQSSRLGFRGNEDLGHGLHAIFWLEGAVNSDDGSSGATNTNNQSSGSTGSGGLTFGRASWVGMRGAFGDVRLGRDFAPHHLNYTHLDPWQTVGVAGSAAHMGRASALAGWGAHSNTAGVRVSNQIEYRTPANLGGFFAHASVFLGENPSTPEATAHDGRGKSLRFGYSAGKILAAVAVARAEFGQTATLGDTKFVNVGAAYDFGGVRLLGMWARDSFKTNVPYDITGWLVGAVSNVGPYEFRAAYSASERSTTGSDAHPRIRKLGLGVGYNFSKRTVLYANVAKLGNSGGSAAALGLATVSPNQGSSGVDIGIRHTF